MFSFFNQSEKRKAQRLQIRHHLKLSLDLLEDRCVPANIVVSGTNDADPGQAANLGGVVAAVNLRQAIQYANTDGDQQNTITFARFLKNVNYFVNTPLPTITASNVTIDATGTGGYAIINGSKSVGGNGNGLTITGSNCVIKGLEIINFGGNGIEIDLADTTKHTGGTNNTISGCLIGTNAAGNANIGNGDDGIFLNGAYGNTIKGNVISGNGFVSGGGVGIHILYTDLANQNLQTYNPGNTIIGNIIGTDITGMNAIGNAEAGIWIQGSPQNLIQGNLISGNPIDGILIEGVFDLPPITKNGATDVSASGNQIFGNLIGLTGDGKQALGGKIGIELQAGSGGTFIGGVKSSQGNVISGNNIGILINETSQQTIYGNYIGLDVTGEKAIGNTQIGIDIENSNNVTIGGTQQGQRNIITGNGGINVFIDQMDSSDNKIIGNYIGLSASGKAIAGVNQTIGVEIQISAQNTIASNVISDNYEIGVYITGDASQENVVEDNKIGTSTDGKSALGTQQTGVMLDDSANNNKIGLDANGAGKKNIISGNKGSGVLIQAGANSNQVNGNYIGTDVTGTVAVGNGGDGVTINNANGNNVSTNVISGNTGNAITITGNNNKGKGNIIGTSPDKTKKIPNGGGIVDTGKGNNIANNLITGGAFGILVQGTGTTVTGNDLVSILGDGIDVVGGLNDTISNNLIGVNPDGTQAANTGSGILVETGSTGANLSNNTIGNNGRYGVEMLGVSSNQTVGNTIFSNTLAGVEVVSGQNDLISQNSIFQNGGLGIDLEMNGNQAQPAPVLTSVTVNSTSVTISGTLTAAASTTYALEFFSNYNSASGQGTTYLGTLYVTTDGSGQASFTVAFTNNGGSFISATATDPNDNTSEYSNTLSAFSNSTGATLSSSANPSTYGQLVTLTVTVAGANGVPTGTVTFMSGSTSLGTATLNGSGRASLTLSSLDVGTYPIVVVYSGDGQNASTISNVVSQIVNQAPSSTSMVSSTASTNFGQSVTLTATVSSSSGTPTGTVDFMDGNVDLGTAVLDSNGVATLTVSSLLTGNNTISAIYSGDPFFVGSSATTTVLVTQADSSTVLTSSMNSATAGESVVLTATVSSSDGVPTGTVTFMDGSLVLGSATLDGDGVATFTIDSLSVGVHDIAAVYSGDTNFNGSSSTGVTVTGIQDSTLTLLNSSATTTTYGQSITFSTSVNGTTTLPVGTVTFMDGSTVLDTVSLDSNGNAILTISDLSVGAHSITAVYNGDFDDSSSVSAAVTVTVSAAATVTTLSSSGGVSTYGQSVTFTATVSSSNAPTSPTGTVTFMDGSTVLATITFTGGMASFTTSALSVGTDSITAVYSGDSNFTGSSSSSLTQTVNQAQTQILLNSSADPSTYGQPVTFTASVTGNEMVQPTGTVTFMDGSTVLGTVTLNTGMATFTTSNLGVGSHSVSAVYSGDTNFAGSSSSLTQTVNQAQSYTMLSSSANPSMFGQPVTFTAMVSGSGMSGQPTGTVTFMDGSTVLATVALSGGTASLTTSSLSVGTHTITAIYSGNGNFGSSSSSPLTQTINPSSSNTTTTLRSSADPSVAGQPVTFTAVVTAMNGMPTGMVIFMDGSTMIGSANLVNGVATFTTSSLMTGTHDITAIYMGNPTDNPSTSNTVTQVVQ